MIEDEYIAYKHSENLSPTDFNDRVKLQLFLRDRIDKIWNENPQLSNGGLFKNKMTGYAIGFAYYDCNPSRYCRRYCYGLSTSGVYDYNMLRLAVITSESLKGTGNYKYIFTLRKFIKDNQLKHIKIGHWGDVVKEQVPIIIQKIVDYFPKVTFWWYTRKLEIAQEINSNLSDNLRAYLSLDPYTNYPSIEQYPNGITYLFDKSCFHSEHKNILQDKRLVAVFALKRGNHIEDIDEYSINKHIKACIEKEFFLKTRNHGEKFCLQCEGRCNFNPIK